MTRLARREMQTRSLLTRLARREMQTISTHQCEDQTFTRLFANYLDSTRLDMDLCCRLTLNHYTASNDSLIQAHFFDSPCWQRLVLPPTPPHLPHPSPATYCLQASPKPPPLAPSMKHILPLPTATPTSLDSVTVTVVFARDLLLAACTGFDGTSAAARGCLRRDPLPDCDHLLLAALRTLLHPPHRASPIISIFSHYG